MEDQIAADTGSGPVPVAPKSWQAVSGQYEQLMLGIQTANAGRFQAQSADSSSSLLTQAVLAGGVGLLAVIVSVFLLLWFGRKVTRDLTTCTTASAAWPRNGCRAWSTGCAAART